LLKTSRTYFPVACGKTVGPDETMNRLPVTASWKMRYVDMEHPAAWSRLQSALIDWPNVSECADSDNEPLLLETQGLLVGSVVMAAAVPAPAAPSTVTPVATMIVVRHRPLILPSQDLLDTAVLAF
jgi:hypothetical protein